MRVVICDDSMLVRDGLARLLTDVGIEVVATASDGRELLDVVELHLPDVVVVDVRMPPTHTDEGLVAAKAIRARHAGIGVLVLSHYIETASAFELLRTGRAVGYLLKERVSDLEAFTEALHTVAAGGAVIDPEVVAHMVRRPREHDPLAVLTTRERDVLALMAEGRSNAGIAQRLVVDPRTVEGHVNRIFAKLGLQPADDDHRRVLAVLTAVR